ncbi:hypothetical protein C8F01DRAFT_1181368 [Mycena amicta]|nr:hypothetical protein C8F01DRAFT_1181368 [Mycena amicta]
MALSIPPEITSDIFALLPTGVISTMDLDALIVPLVLGQVCREWRSISRGTPALWRTLTLNIHDDAGESRERCLALEELVAGWIERSGQQPLHLSMSASHPYSWESAFMIYLIETHASRIQELHLDLENVRFAQFAADGASARFPILRSFSGRVKSTPSTHFSFALLEHSPLLREFAFNSDVLLASSLYIPWAQLVRFSASNGLDTAQVLKILSLATCLEEFTHRSQAVSRSRNTSIDLANMTALVHPCLRKMDIYGTSIHAVLLPLLRLPKLEDLSLVLTYGARSIEDLLAFIERSDCRLKRLKIGASLGSRELRTLFAAVSQLDKLSYTCTLLGELISVLASTSPDPFLPNLKSLAFTTDTFVPPRYLSLVEMLESRAQENSGCARVKEFSVTFTSQITTTTLLKKVVERLERLKGDGTRTRMVVLAKYRASAVDRVLFD